MFRANIAGFSDASGLSQGQANSSASVQPNAGFEHSLHNARGDELPYARYGFSTLSNAPLPVLAVELPRIVLDPPQSSLMPDGTAHAAPDQYSADEAAIFGAPSPTSARMMDLQAPPMPERADTTGKPQTAEEAGYVPFEANEKFVAELSVFKAVGQEETRRGKTKILRKTYRNIPSKQQPVILVNDVIVPVRTADLRYPDANPSQRGRYYLHKDPTIEVMSRGAASLRLERKRERELQHQMPLLPV